MKILPVGCFFLLVCIQVSCAATADIYENPELVGKCFSYRFNVDYQQGDGTAVGRHLMKLKGFDYFHNTDGKPERRIVVNKKGCVAQVSKLISEKNVNGVQIYYELTSKNNLCGTEHVYHYDWDSCMQRLNQISKVPEIKRPMPDPQFCFITRYVWQVDCP